MRERLVTIPIPYVYPGAAAALGDNFAYYYTRMDLTVVYVSAAPAADDADATLDINDDGTGVITAIDVSDADVPGEWRTPMFGGTQTPVRIASGSKVSFDANSAANGNGFVGYILALASEA